LNQTDTSGEEGAEEGYSEEAKKGGEEMKRKRHFILAVLVAIIIVATAEYLGLISDLAVRLGGHVISLIL